MATKPQRIVRISNDGLVLTWSETGGPAAFKKSSRFRDGTDHRDYPDLIELPMSGVVYEGGVAFVVVSEEYERYRRREEAAWLGGLTTE